MKPILNHAPYQHRSKQNHFVTFCLGHFKNYLPYLTNIFFHICMDSLYEKLSLGPLRRTPPVTLTLQVFFFFFFGYQKAVIKQLPHSSLLTPHTCQGRSA
jgi:hypothetical protein